MKSVLISIQPKWCEKIARGKKTVEVRKTRPKIETPFKCYIYCTKNKHPNGHDLLELHIDGKIKKMNCKVIGEFVCDYITMLKADSKIQCMYNKEMNTCMTDEEIVKYAGFEKPLYYWHISDLVIYDKPKSLSEFYRPCNHDCMSCELGKYDMELHDTLCTANPPSRIPITRPPQSWCYVEEVTG